MSRLPHPTPETAGLDTRDYPELLEPVTCSWPVLETSLERARRMPSPRLGRWMQGLTVKAALFWLEVSLGLVTARMACEEFARSRRR
jgi:hypothetical protein